VFVRYHRQFYCGRSVAVWFNIGDRVYGWITLKPIGVNIPPTLYRLLPDDLINRMAADRGCNELFTYDGEG